MRARRGLLAAREPGGQRQRIGIARALLAAVPELPGTSPAPSRVPA